jgi:hypothetical protein
MTRFSSAQSSIFTWSEIDLEAVTIQNPSFTSPIVPTGTKLLTLSNLISTQPLPNWTFLTDSSQIMIGKGSTIYNMSDAASNQYLIGSYNITEDNRLSQSIYIITPGLYKIIYYTNGRLAFQALMTVQLYINNITSIRKIVSSPNSANWRKETVILYIPSPGIYTLIIRLMGHNQQITSITNISMCRFERRVL